VSWRASCANAFTTRTPATFSSASAVSSAIRCCTSCEAGRFFFPYTNATQITNGVGASVTAASPGFTAIITPAAIRIVSADCAMKMSP
jgi:hypothetical protein